MTMTVTMTRIVMTTTMVIMMTKMTITVTMKPTTTVTILTMVTWYDTAEKRQRNSLISHAIEDDGRSRTDQRLSANVPILRLQDD